jgi:hypothetical protein
VAGREKSGRLELLAQCVRLAASSSRTEPHGVANTYAFVSFRLDTHTPSNVRNWIRLVESLDKNRGGAQSIPKRCDLSKF